MAGDWIKMRVDLADDPAVVRIAEQLELSEDEVVGKLHRLWSWADRHTVDGFAPGITAKWVDRYVSCTGFANVMSIAGWIAFDDDGVRFPNFERHNGDSAKKRCNTAERVRLHRRYKGVTGDERTKIPRPFCRIVLERDSYTCVYCGTESDANREQSRKKLLSIDHIIPCSRGGATTVDNLVTCCRLCNNEKNDRTPEEWGMPLAFLQDGVSYKDGFVTDSRYTSVTKALPEKRREEKITKGVNPLKPQATSGDAKNGKAAEPEIPAALQSHPAFQKAWSDWLAYRRERRVKTTQRTIDSQLEMLAGFGPDIAVESIRLSIRNGWQGLFDPKDKRYAGKSGPTIGPGQRHDPSAGGGTIGTF